MSRAGAEAACPLWLGEGRVCSRADLLTLADHGNAGVGHRESASQILFPVDADVRSRSAGPPWLGGGRVCSRAALLPLADHGNAGVGRRESASQILFPVDADVRSRWHDDVLVDDGVPDSGVATDLDEVEQDAVRDGRVAVDVNTGGEH